VTTQDSSRGSSAEQSGRKYERIFDALVAAMENPECGGEAAWNVMQAAWDDPDYWVAGLAKLLGHPNPRVRALAAATILRGAPRETPYVVADDLLGRSATVLQEGLRTGGWVERGLICGFLVGGGMPASLVPTIQGYLKDPIMVVRVTAASALAGSGHADARVKRALLDGLYCEEPGLVTMAAALLAQLKEHANESIARLTELLPKMQDAWQVSALLTLRRVGRAASGAQTAVERLATDPERPAIVRSHALATLGCIGRERVSLAKTILRHLGDVDTTVVLGAVEGLVMCGEVPDEALEPLVRLLDVEDERVRWAVLRGFGMLGAKAMLAGPVLIARFGREENEKREEDVAVALAGIGVGVVRPRLPDAALPSRQTSAPRVAQRSGTEKRLPRARRPSRWANLKWGESDWFDAAAMAPASPRSTMHRRFAELSLSRIAGMGCSSRPTTPHPAGSAGDTGMFAPKVLGPVRVLPQSADGTYPVVSGHDLLVRLRAEGRSSAVVEVIGETPDACSSSMTFGDTMAQAVTVLFGRDSYIRIVAPRLTLDTVIQLSGETLALATRIAAGGGSPADLTTVTTIPDAAPAAGGDH
jgi:HEAT repeat protein